MGFQKVEDFGMKSMFVYCWHEEKYDKWYLYIKEYRTQTVSLPKLHAFAIFRTIYLF